MLAEYTENPDIKQLFYEHPYITVHMNARERKDYYNTFQKKDKAEKKFGNTFVQGPGISMAPRMPMIPQGMYPPPMMNQVPMNPPPMPSNSNYMNKPL